MRRWIPRILICLLLGAVTTAAVAWALALTMPMLGVPTSGVPPVGKERPRWAIGTSRDLGALDILAAADWPSDVRLGIEQIDEFQVPGWSRAAHPPTPDEVESLSLIFESARGWPMLSLYRRMTYPSASQPSNWRTEWGWETDFTGRFAKSRTMPLAVIWPGFLIDTLVYGVLWFGLIFGFGAARRALRTRRGRCPQCAYDLRGYLDAGCPECGWGRDKSAPRH